MLLSALPLGMVDTAYAAAALASGKCGDSATWTLDSTGTLTISGTGATYNYDMDDDGNSAAPWCTKARIQRVNKVVVNSGITELGYSMFSNCTQLTSVSLPSGLKRIGSCLFLGCTRLSAITIPSSVTTIESNAFTHCDSITAITLPSGLRTMGDAVCSQMAKLTTATVSSGVTYLSNYAFNDCPSLKTITLPNTVRSIGICAFRYDTALKDVYFNGSVTQWTSIQIAGEGNSALYNADVHCTGLPAPTVTGGNDAQGRPTLRWNAVSGAAKYEVYRARSKDGDYIKYSTVTGTSYTNISYIENGNTYYYKVRALDASGTAGAWSDVVAVTCRLGLTAPTVTGGNDAQGRPTLKWNAVSGAAKYEVYRARSKDGDYIKYSTVTGTSYTNTSYIENGNTYYYKVRALDTNGTAGAWSSIVSVTYKQTLSAPTVTGGKDSQGRPTLKWNAVSGAAKYEVYRARSLNGDYIKYSTVTGTSYTNTSYIENGNTYYYKVRALDANGTAGAWSSIVSVTYKQTLPAPTATGGNDAQGRPTLKWKVVTGAAKYEVYRARSLNGDYIKYSTVTGTSYTNTSYIEDDNTYYYKVRALKSDGTAGAWSSIVSVTYKQTLSAPTVTGGNDAQGRPTLKWNAVTGAAKYEVYRARSKDGTYTKYSTTTGTAYTNSSYLTSGATYYYKVRALKSDGTAGAWSSIVSVTYRKPAAATVASGKCGDSAKWTLDAAGTLTISGTGATYDFFNDYNCTAPWYDAELRLQIKKAVVNKGITYVGTYAFRDCAELTSVSLPAGLEEMGSSVFRYCESLTSITIPAGVTSIGGDFFYGCASLKSVTLPDSLWDAGGCTFMDCASLTSVRLPANLRDIAWWMFKDCTNLTSVTIPRGIVEVKKEAFDGCTSLKNVTFTGSAADWKGVTIRPGNTALTSAAIKCTGSTVLTAPTLTLSVSKKGQPTLKWSAVSGAAGYQLWCSYDGGDDGDPYYRWFVNNDKTATSYTVPTDYLEKGRTYTYKVRAVTSSGAVGSFSKEVTFTYNPAASLAAPTVTGGNDAQGRPTLKWNAVTGAAKYEVYRARSRSGEYIKYSTVTGTSYTNTSYIENGNTYYYKVRALKSDGTAGAWSSLVAVTYKQTLSAPAVTGGNDAQGRPTLKWNAVSGAAKYEVYRARSLNGDYIKYSTVTGTSYTNTSYIENGNTYYYKVRALDASGTAGAWSSVVSVTYKQTLSAPAVTGGNDAQGRPTLKWNAVTGAAKYEVYRARSKDGTYTKYSTTTGTAYTNSSYLTSGATYYYKVRALDANGNAGPYSAVVSVTCRLKLTAPTVTGGTDAQGRPTLKWNAVTGAAKYEVYRARSKDGDYIKYSTVTGTSYTNTSYLANGTTYYYKVRALGSDGSYGPYSTPVSVTYKAPFGAPLVTGSKDSQGRPALKWDKVTDAAKYEVYRARSKDGTYSLMSTQSATGYTNTSYLANGTTYYYKVRALKANGTASAYSSVVTITYGTVPTPAAPAMRSAKADSAGITVSWDTAANAVTYNVYRTTDAGSSWTQVASSVKGSSYKDTTVQKGVKYGYKVRGVAADGKTLGPMSPTGVTAKVTAASTTPDYVKLTSARRVTGGIQLTWESAADAKTYNVYRKVDGASGWTLLASSVSGTTYKDTSGKSGTTYAYTVRGVAADGKTLSRTYNTDGLRATMP